MLFASRMHSCNATHLELVHALGIASQHEPRVRETLERLAPDEEGHGWCCGRTSLVFLLYTFTSCHVALLDFA